MKLFMRKVKMNNLFKEIITLQMKIVKFMKKVIII